MAYYCTVATESMRISSGSPTSDLREAMCPCRRTKGMASMIPFDFCPPPKFAFVWVARISGPMGFPQEVKKSTKTVRTGQGLEVGQLVGLLVAAHGTGGCLAVGAHIDHRLGISEKRRASAGALEGIVLQL